MMGAPATDHDVCQPMLSSLVTGDAGVKKFWSGCVRNMQRVLWRASLPFRPKQRQVRRTTYLGRPLLVHANEDIGWRLLLFHSYEKLELNALKRLIRPTDVCVDVGANIGIFTVMMAGWAYKGQVHAFEPDPEARNLLLSNLELNELQRVAVHACPLAEESRVESFSQSEDSAFSSLRNTGRKSERRQLEVCCKTLDSIFVHERIDVLKIDVEGTEQRVLLGAEALFADPTRRPRVVLVEACEENLRAYGHSVERLVQFFRPLGYDPFTFGPTRLDAGLKIDRTEKSVNLLFVRERSR